MGKESKRPDRCTNCHFYEDDRVNDDGDWVEGVGCCYPYKCFKSECYPCPIGNVGICPHNENEHCNLFNKKCNNIIEQEYYNG